jgi:hypothetical protein
MGRVVTLRVRSRAGLRGRPHRFLPSRRARQGQGGDPVCRGRRLGAGSNAGSHRQYRHPNRPGLVTIAGKPSDTLHPKTWASIVKQAGLPEQDR